MATLAETIASFLLTYALHSTLLIGVVWAWMRIKAPRSARVRETLWSLALIGGVVSALMQSSGVSGTRVWTLEFARAAALDPTVGPATPIALSIPNPNATDDTARAASSTNATTPGFAANLGAMLRAAGDAMRRLSLGTSTAFAWIAGALAVLLLLFARTALWRLTRLPRRREVIGEPAAALERLVRSTGLTRSVRLTSSDQLGVPIAFGLLRPEICVPARSLAELDAMQRDAMLAHELAHLVRRDPLRLLAARVVESVFFFQPLNRLARKRMFEAVEFRCDALAVRLTGQSISLASCLAQVAEWMRDDYGRASPVATAMASHARNPSALVRRIERLLDDTDLHADERGGRAALALPAALFLGLLAAAPAIATTPRVPERAPLMPSVVQGGSAAPTIDIAPTSDLAVALRAANAALEHELMALRVELHQFAAERAAGRADPAVANVLTKLQDRLETLDRHRRTLIADIDRLAADEGLDPQTRTLPAASPQRNEP